MPIPKTINFMWLGKQLSVTEYPEKYQKYLDTWIEHNPDFEIRIWYWRDLIELLDSHPELKREKDFLMNLTPLISQCDFGRFLIIYLLGGMYVDLDFYCDRNVSELLENKEEFYVFEPIEHEEYRQTGLLFNGIFASAPDSEFIRGWLNYMMNSDTNDSVMWRTGPMAFHKYYASLNDSSKPRVNREDTCKVLSQINVDYDMRTSNKCLKAEKPYCYTIWTDGSGWGRIEWMNWLIKIGLWVVLFVIIVKLMRIN